jgi:hypothetical protein
VLAAGYLFTAGMAAVHTLSLEAFSYSVFFTLRPGAPAEAMPEPRGAPR